MTPDIAIFFPDLRGGGAEKVCVDLARGFLARGLRVDLVLMRAEGVWKSALPAEAGVVDFGVTRIRSSVGPLVSYLREQRPRALLAAMWPMTSIAVLAARLARVDTRVVLSDHNDLGQTPQGSSLLGRIVMTGTMRLSYPSASSVIAVSHGVARTISRLSGLPLPRIRVIYNPIAISNDPLDPADDVARSWTASGSSRRVIAIGSFKPQKDFENLLRAFSTAARSMPMKLLILGDGPLRGRLETLARELRVGDSVVMPGFVDRPERYLRRADLLVLSSAWEGFGNVIVEALACGVPVVSTDCPSGPSEILENGRFGRLVPPRDPQALAGAIVDWLNRSHDRDALLARAHFFSPDRSVIDHLQLLLPHG